VTTVLALSVLYAARGGREWLARQQASAASAARADAQRLDSLRADLRARSADTTPIAAFGDPRSPYTAGTTMARRWVVLPTAPLGPVAAGQSDLFPTYYRVSILAHETLFTNEELDHPANLLAGRFDLAFVVVFLFPLLVIALSYNVLSAEREQGTLRLVLAQPVTLRTVLLGKLAARAAVLLLAAVVLVLAGALAAGVAPLAPGAAAGLALAVLLVVAYGLVWFALALLVNVVGRSSAANAMALLGCWLAAVVLVPSLLAAGVAALYPAPSRVELVQARREASRAATARGAQLLAAYMQDHPELVSGPVDGANAQLRALAVQDDVDRAVAPVTRRFEAQLARQQAAVARLEVLSPALLAHDALTALAGTDAGRLRRFGAAAADHSLRLRAYWSPLVARGARITSADVDRIPPFAWDASAGAAPTRVALAAALRLLLLTAALALAALGSRRGGRATLVD
jgi:ABC-2 type transport system permease protein